MSANASNAAGISPDRIDPQRLTVLLKSVGWQLRTGREGIYNRLIPPSSLEHPDSRPRSLLVPLNKNAPDYNLLMNAALTELDEADRRDRWSEVLPRLRSEPTDSFRFRKESAAPSGLISWRQGEELILSARSTLIAGAKTRVEKLRRYSNRLGHFASRYLDSVLMGQTAAGSYVVTAYAPTNITIPISATRTVNQSIPGTDTVLARSVTSSIASSLEAATDALNHYRSTGSYSGFEDGVRSGLSYDLAVALQGITSDSSGSEILVEWDPSEPLNNSGLSSVYEFKGSDAGVFESAANRLGSANQGVVTTTAIGRVHLLTKKRAGGPGVFGLDTIGSPGRKYRVRLLDAEQYHLATRAHDEDLAIRVRGDLEREGSISWLYNAEIQGIVGPVSELPGFGPDSIAAPAPKGQLMIDGPEDTPE
ncbi:hypothetical protein [Amycolatopsis sp. YIM 10]|uniref:hypothetical protein n=1 Tax=Amycolatopsis sp. YIM 10 TaxID=2653857 RepID=UPI0012906AC9|nr:hypothetical protein [Amycolatopsis sp. YIM 10]QFU94071.1 hypothetical protein YIM_44700 [Amycolatopsis sp. YIM 10]